MYRPLRRGPIVGVTTFLEGSPFRRAVARSDQAALTVLSATKKAGHRSARLKSYIIWVRLDVQRNPITFAEANSAEGEDSAQADNEERTGFRHGVNECRITEAIWLSA